MIVTRKPRMMRWSLTITCWLASSCCLAEDEERVRRYPPGEVTVQSSDRSLTIKLTGYAKRELLGRSIYLISSYCEHQPDLDSAAEILAFPGLKQLRIRMLSKLPSSLIARMIRRSISSCDREERLAAEIKLIEEHLRQHQFQVGDEIILTNLPGRGLSCHINASPPIVMESPALARVVWSIYFGDPPYHGEFMPRQLTKLIVPRDATEPPADTRVDGEAVQRGAGDSLKPANHRP